MTGFATRLATCFGIGRTPYLPGTAASIAALPLGWALTLMGWQAVIVAVLLVTLVGIWACDVHARASGVKDPSECVIDEVAGQWLALVPIALEGFAQDWRAFVMALFLFRVFDMWKPWPVSAAERLGGGFGIVADDIVAGGIAAAILYGMLAIRLV
jgi:phosphatidylglycerophosphatase A